MPLELGQDAENREQSPLVAFRRDELDLLEAHLGEIVAELAPGTVLVELGCGDGSKTVTLLRALLERDGAGGVTYAGIDCSAEALQQMKRTLQSTLPALSMDSVALIEAEYAEGVRLARERFPDAPLAVLFLGSSIGNFAHPEAVQLLRQLREVAGQRVVLVLGCDLMKAADTLHAAYCDSAGVTEAFIKNGMRHALRSVGHPLAEREDCWDYEVLVNAEEEQVEMYLVARESVPDVFPGVTIERGERVLMEISRKFTGGGLRALAFEAGYCHHVSAGMSLGPACPATMWRPRVTGPAPLLHCRPPGTALGGTAYSCCCPRWRLRSGAGRTRTGCLPAYRTGPLSRLGCATPSSSTMATSQPLPSCGCSLGQGRASWTSACPVESTHRCWTHPSATRTRSRQPPAGLPGRSCWTMPAR